MRIGGLPHLVTSCSTSEVLSSFNKLVPGVEEEVELCLCSKVHEGFRTAIKVVGVTTCGSTWPTSGPRGVRATKPNLKNAPGRPTTYDEWTNTSKERADPRTMLGLAVLLC